MLRYRLSESDLGEIRFGVSPLCELGLSLRALRDPARYPSQVPWLMRTRDARDRLDLAPLLSLLDERMWTPDFLNPRPDSPLTTIESEMAALARIDPRIFVTSIEKVHGHVPPAFTGPPRRALERTLAALGAYWDGVFAPWWPRMRSVLQADIVHRGRQMAGLGLSAMLGGLSAKVEFDDNVLSVHLADRRQRTVDIAGRGLTLVPTMFTRGASVPVDDAEPPMLLYAARGHGMMWATEKPASAAAVAELLGRTRAALLAALAEPASSTELALRFEVTTSAVNQHLRALHAGGLVTSTRYGRSVLYFRSELGEALLG
jgi:DNA-binding transcriptional ArsR family regulator